MPISNKIILGALCTKIHDMPCNRIITIRSEQQHKVLSLNLAQIKNAHRECFYNKSNNLKNLEKYFPPNGRINLKNEEKLISITPNYLRAKYLKAKKVNPCEIKKINEALTKKSKNFLNRTNKKIIDEKCRELMMKGHRQVNFCWVKLFEYREFQA